ncbi:hypothetical protein G0U57_021237 [Chelydra serpentina]|uniref:Uncharacterized protein n=1 Tax=Chelydra serpentina TaxID=8475 RepID=A0A8T1S2N3_CHESE|nr:hypothetical protein G0U57_021237 [Chelydra serpentina]
MELTEPVHVVHVAVHASLNHCHREKLLEDCEGCVLNAPAQWHHDCVSWSSRDINSKLWDLYVDRCLESLLNTVIAIGYALQCLCPTQEHLTQGVTLANAVQFGRDPDSVLKKMTKPEDACLERYIDHLVCTKSYRTLLTKKTICKKLKRIKLENGEGTNM